MFSQVPHTSENLCVDTHSVGLKGVTVVVRISIIIAIVGNNNS